MEVEKLLSLKACQTIYLVHSPSGSVHEMFLLKRPIDDDYSVSIFGKSQFILSDNVTVNDPDSGEHCVFLYKNKDSYTVTQSKAQALRWARRRLSYGETNKCIQVQ